MITFYRSLVEALRSKSFHSSTKTKKHTKLWTTDLHAVNDADTEYMLCVRAGATERHVDSLVDGLGQLLEVAVVWIILQRNVDIREHAVYMHAHTLAYKTYHLYHF